MVNINVTSVLYNLWYCNIFNIQTSVEIYPWTDSVQNRSEISVHCIRTLYAHTHTHTQICIRTYTDTHMRRSQFFVIHCSWFSLCCIVGENNWNRSKQSFLEKEITKFYQQQRNSRHLEVLIVLFNNWTGSLKYIWNSIERVLLDENNNIILTFTSPPEFFFDFL